VQVGAFYQVSSSNVHTSNEGMQQIFHTQGFKIMHIQELVIELCYLQQMRPSQKCKFAKLSLPLKAAAMQTRTKMVKPNEVAMDSTLAASRLFAAGFAASNTKMVLECVSIRA